MPTTTEGRTEDDGGHWANVDLRLHVDDAARGARGRMVSGRLLSGPIQGFGKMWQKTYRVRFADVSVTPTEVISTWKQHFPEFWPPGNRFYAPLTGLAPGEVALLDLSLAPGAGLSTGVLVLYADAESFTLMTPQGHVLSGWITFSAFAEAGETLAQAHVLMRAADPICELGLMLGGHRREDQFWSATLTNLARHFGVPAPSVDSRVVCVDSRRQWSRFGNIRHNGPVRTSLDRAADPVRWAAGLPSRAVRRRR